MINIDRLKGPSGLPSNEIKWLDREADHSVYEDVELMERMYGT
jgi:hypothetical protein